MNKKVIRNRRSLITFFVFATLFALAATIYIKKRRALRENYGITSGIITNYTDAAKSAGGSFDFEFYVDSSRIESTSATSQVYKWRAEQLVGKRFPVVYSLDNPSNSDMLIFPNDFAEFDISFPDSLQWVLQYKIDD